jgi:hypothetical protein
MANTYTWELKSLRKMNSGSYDNIIFGTTWAVTATDEDGVTGTFSGATPFRADEINPDEFVPYSQLNEEIVLNWIKYSVSESAVNSYWPHIEGQIQKQINDTKFQVSTVDYMNFPWTPSGSGTPTP